MVLTLFSGERARRFDPVAFNMMRSEGWRRNPFAPEEGDSTGSFIPPPSIISLVADLRLYVYSALMRSFHVVNSVSSLLLSGGEIKPPKTAGSLFLSEKRFHSSFFLLSTLIGGTGGDGDDVLVPDA